MMAKVEDKERPAGFSSRVRKLEGCERQKQWEAPNGQRVTLPLLVDHVNTDAETGACISCVEAIVDFVEGELGLVEVRLKGHPKLDVDLLQRFFRWNTPIDIVRYLIPSLLINGINPYEYWYPTDGFPDACLIDRKHNARLTDEFLKNIARQYIEIGKGYAEVIADQKGVSERTVVSWIEKARKRGILEPTVSGKRTYKIRD